MLRPVARVLVVHHDPPRGGDIAVERLARAVRALSGAEVAACPVSEARECRGPCDLGVALFLGRGGHASDALKALHGTCRSTIGPVPHWLTALHIASTLAGSVPAGGRVYLLYHEARRGREEQARDYAMIAGLAEKLLRDLHGVEARLEAIGRREASSRGLEGLLLSVMPGPGRRISLLSGEPGFSLVTAWILGGLQGLSPWHA